MTRPVLIGLSAAILAFTALGPARAQQADIAGTIDALLDDALTLEAKDAAPGAPPPLATAAEEVSADQAQSFREAALRFEPDPALRAQAMRQFLDLLGGISPEIGAQMQGQDVFAILQPALDEYGMSINDFADTSTLLLLTMYEAARLEELDDETTPEDIATAKAVSRQIAAAYASLNRPEMSDPEAVQMQSDSYVTQALMFYMLHAAVMTPDMPQARRDEFAAQVVKTGQQLFGVDLLEADISELGLLTTQGRRDIEMQALGFLQQAVDDEREKRVAEDPEAEAERALQTAFGTPCGRQPSDPTERKVLNLLERRSLCDGYDPARYAQFKAEVPADQLYAINFVAWLGGNALYPPEQAKMMDGMMD